MHLPAVTLEDWRRLVDKELAGKDFDRALVYRPTEGVAIAPLYTEAPPPDPAARYARPSPFRICMRHEAGASQADLVADAAEGADALWVPLEVALSGALASEALADTSFVVEAPGVPSAETFERIAAGRATGASPALVLGVDPIASRAEGRADFASLASDLASLGRLALGAWERRAAATTVVVSGLPYHDAGADAADELAIALSTGARYLEALLGAGLSPVSARAAIALRVAVGRDSFVELCKLRALRVCWEKMLVACGASVLSGTGRTLVHAVCSTPALSVRDPWVNMLRVTTQVFSAVTGGADLVTPRAFDQAFGAPSPLGRRVARNTGLVLREESMLGKVSDPAGGSYYFDTLTDTLAREAWERFRALEREGGVVAALESGRLAARLEGAWRRRLERIATRRHPVLGVSDFANLDEALPHAAPDDEAPALAEGGLPGRRDAAPFERLRLRADAIAPRPEALLVPLGSPAESRPRVGFAAGLLAAGGVRAREGHAEERAVVACLCGSDEQYAAEAAERARSLKAAGALRVLVAGRPGALEAPLREAGVDGFVYVGCDALAELEEILATLVRASEEPS
ncbi:MAG: hypothetical protein KF894_21910 [Labilithrix sp.]|nr:hypothetical protein [Labilithrix sp.]